VVRALELGDGGRGAREGREDYKAGFKLRFGELNGARLMGEYRSKAEVGGNGHRMRGDAR
jgi:hypothetical protein